MAKKAYIGVNGTARKVKKIYIGVGGIARKVKKAYIGVGGVARPCWSEGLEYYGTITPLSMARYRLAAATVGNYAIFAGGYSDASLDAVEAYTDTLTKTSCEALSEPRDYLQAATVGDYALFAGGRDSSYSDGNVSTNAVDAYNSSLTRTNPSSELYIEASYHTGVSTNKYAMFGGGRNYFDTGYASGMLNVYDSYLTRTIKTLSRYKQLMGAAYVGDYALFAGGYKYESSSSSNKGYISDVDAVSSSLTRTSANSLSSARQQIMATTVGDYALFAGGYDGTRSSAVDVYNSSLVHSVLTVGLSVARNNGTATTVGNYALFACGVGTSYFDVVDVFDSSLTRTIGTALSIGRSELASTAIGKYAIFAGGKVDDDGNSSNAVDVYTI